MIYFHFVQYSEYSRDVSCFLCRALIKLLLVTFPYGSLGGLHALFCELPTWEWSLGHRECLASGLEVKLFQSGCSSHYAPTGLCGCQGSSSLIAPAKVSPNAARLPGLVFLMESGSLVYFLVSALVTSGSCVVHSLSIFDNCLH